ncbi:hypothetical protein [Vibrio diazotrophicus]|nr:hypothetical protein [Vibrio diazotrophicus]
MSLEEAEEFANNLWLEYNGKDTLDNSKKSGMVQQMLRELINSLKD